jgi:isopentenyldiphosphate isomerase
LIGAYGGEPAPAPAEVADWRWVSTGELRRALREEPRRYTRWLKLAVEGEHRRALFADEDDLDEDDLQDARQVTVQRGGDEDG